ncbi:uncharacterized protein LOC122257890 [Penaeus japonicus]|uniref:uncharacterized protein LOC122257890 n=1 Tax=Penaeus japonicus TaxID=27405 RepID=UPI001C716E99|nr:uncharacterized protein LOC122257890 [Penaeus japonicus]
MAASLIALNAKSRRKNLRNRAPSWVIMRSGKNFTSAVIRNFCALYGIEKIRTSAYHPQGNGVCERFNRTLHDLLVTLEEPTKKKWPNYTSGLVTIYNATLHAATGHFPFHLLFGGEPKLPRDAKDLGDSENTTDEWLNDLEERLWDVAKKIESKRKIQSRKVRDEPAKSVQWDIGHKVLLRTNVKVGRCKMQNQWYDEGWEIVEVLDGKAGLYKIRQSDVYGTERIENRLNIKSALNLRPSGMKTKYEEEGFIYET